jgi:hypothetical protein
VFVWQNRNLASAGFDSRIGQRARFFGQQVEDCIFGGDGKQEGVPSNTNAKSETTATRYFRQALSYGPPEAAEKVTTPESQRNIVSVLWM